MKNTFLSTCLILLASLSFAQDGSDFIELLEGDTLYGNVWDVEPSHLRFESKETGKTAMVAIEMLKTFKRQGEIIVVADMLRAQEKEKELSYPEEEKLHIAGLKLQKSAGLFYGGAAVTVLGAVATVVGSTRTANDGKTGRIIGYVGVGATVVGTLVSASAFVPIAEAGLQLQKIKLGK